MPPEHKVHLCLMYLALRSLQLPDIDLEGLFSNTDDILHVSRQFLKGLEATATQEHEQQLHDISKWCSTKS